MAANMSGGPEDHLKIRLGRNARPLTVVAGQGPGQYGVAGYQLPQVPVDHRAPPVVGPPPAR
ncbi:hypothetical protein P3T35_000101 [Kitasatospora sp. GP30]|nr:hypothetical protein [Kitasatospora sp. GP30]